jgi:hypothetical protein
MRAPAPSAPAAAAAFEGNRLSSGTCAQQLSYGHLCKPQPVQHGPDRTAIWLRNKQAKINLPCIEGQYIKKRMGEGYRS